MGHARFHRWSHAAQRCGGNEEHEVSEDIEMWAVVDGIARNEEARSCLWCPTCWDPVKKSERSMKNHWVGDPVTFEDSLITLFPAGDDKSLFSQVSIRVDVVQKSY